MASLPISLQLYSLRDDCPKDFPGTLKKVAEMGFDAVEFAGYHGFSGSELKTILDDLGLKCSGTHTAVEDVETKLDETLELHHQLGAQNIIVPWLPLEMHDTEEATLKTAAKLSALVPQVEAAGLRLGFHAHGADMKPLDSGKTTWYVLAENTPDSFLLQFDTANSMEGGSDPVQPLIDFPGRGKTVHIKEFPFDGCSLGEGLVPIKKVLEALPIAGTEWLVLEQEQYGSRTPLESVAVSFKNLKAAF